MRREDSFPVLCLWQRHVLSSRLAEAALRLFTTKGYEQQDKERVRARQAVITSATELRERE